MRSFELTVPGNVADACSALVADPTARLIAGGTTLLDLMKLEVETPGHVIDVTQLGRVNPELIRVSRLAGGGVRLGALALNSVVARHPLIVSAYPMLSQALLAGASGQIRNMATVGGNLLQRTRCWYFRDTAMPCNKRMPGSGCSAIGGQARMHAVLGTSASCIATHPSDMCVPLAALDAVIQVEGGGGPRSIPFAEFHTLPGDHPERENTLRPGEIVVAVDIPPLPFARRSVYVKVRDRASYAFALASAAVALDIAGGRITAARVALGGLGTRPWRADAAETALIGAVPDEAAWTAAADAALQGARTQADNAFKVPLGRRTIIRALRSAGALA
jgi:xanthine dehydrogenase YagS FAD-binding subunit